MGGEPAPSFDSACPGVCWIGILTGYESMSSTTKKMQVTDMNPEEAFLATVKPDWTRHEVLSKLGPLAGPATFLFGGYDAWIPVIVKGLEWFADLGLMYKTTVVWLFLQSLRLVAYFMRKTSVKKTKQVAFYFLTGFSILVGVGLAGGFSFSALEWWRAAPVVKKFVKKVATGEDDEDEEL